jgi:hypothetical protein
MVTVTGLLIDLVALSGVEEDPGGLHFCYLTSQRAWD